MPFKTALKVELIDDLANNGQGEWALLEPLIYVDNKGYQHTWFLVVSRSDMASVPAPGGLCCVRQSCLSPAVIHDYYCRTAQDK